MYRRFDHDRRLRGGRKPRGWFPPMMQRRVIRRMRSQRRPRLWNRLLRTHQCRRRKKRASQGQNAGRDAPVAQNQPSTSAQQDVQVQQSTRTEPSVLAQSSTPVQPSMSAGYTAIQTVPRAPRRIEIRTLGPGDNSHIQEGAARRGSAFPRSFKFPGGGVFKMR